MRSRSRAEDMNEAAVLILSEAATGGPATPHEVAARGAAVAILGKRAARKQPPAAAKGRRPAKR
jgi:hypothetical protein